MNLQPLEHYTELARTLVEDDVNEGKREVWRAVDKMVACEVEIPQEIQEWAGPNAKFASPILADSVQAIKRFLAPRLPEINLMPMHPDQSERDQVEKIEQVLEWEFHLLNRRLSEPVFSKIVDSAARYSAVAFQTKYHLYEAKRTVGKSGRKLYDKRFLDRVFRNGHFNWVVHNPQNVYPTYSDDMLDDVLLTQVRPLRAVVAEYGSDNPTIKKILAEVGDDPATINETYLSMFDYTNQYCRAVWARINGSDASLTLDGDEYVFQRAEHKLPFIPWVVVDFNAPMFETIYRSGTYDQRSQVAAVLMAKTLAHGAQTDDYIQTTTPDNPNIVQDTSNPTQERVVDNQTTPIRLQPHPPDPGLLAMLQYFDGNIVRSAAVTPLLDVGDIGGNTPFMSINARQSTAVAQLGVVQQVVERASEGGLQQMLDWVDYSKEPVIGYRSRGNGSGALQQVGSQFMIQSAQSVPMEDVMDEAGNVVDKQPAPFPPNVVYFDSKKVYVTVKLKPMMIQDKQAEAALAQLRQAVGYSKRKSLEEMGVDNSDMMLEETYGEMLEGSIIQSQIMRDQKAVELEAMQAQMQMQLAQQQQMMQMQQSQPQQPQSPDNQARDANAPEFQATQGMDGRFGGPTPAQTVPGKNRNQVNRRDDGGRPA